MTTRRFYALSLAAVTLASAYPIYMGASTMLSYFQNGYIDVADYHKYIIPYTPICIALIAVTALLPLLFKLFRRHTLLAASALGTVLFLITEIGFEQIKVLEGYSEIVMPLESWQYSLCIATPEVLRAIGEPIYAQNNPAFKIHFYIIALVIIMAVINVLYGFSKMLKNGDWAKRRPLIAQLVCVVAFIGLCILACFTAFYRNGTIDISALSASLMSVFFIVFGVTVGVYFGCIFYGKRRLLSEVIPALVAAAAVSAMYIAELALMGGVLFKFGSGFIFEPIGALPFALIDIAVIVCAALITYGVSRFVNKR